MPHIQPLTIDDLPGFEMIADGARDTLGVIPNSMLTMGKKPAILGAFALLVGAVFHQRPKSRFSMNSLRFFKTFLKALGTPDPPNEVDSQLQQMIAYISSVAAGCRYCQAHTAGSAKLVGVPEGKIEALLKYDTSPLFSDAERAALGLAFAAGQVPNRANASHFTELKKHFNDAQIVEIVAVIALFGYLNRWNDTMATALENSPRNFAEQHLTQAASWEIGKH